MSVKKSVRKIVTLFSLFAFAASAFWLDFSPVQADVSTEMVYCPLTKKFQPVHSPKKSVRTISLKDFCAADREKTEFAQAFLANPVAVSFAETQMENLALDFFQSGKIAVKKLPNLPHEPNQYSAKTFNPLTGTGNFDKQFSFLKTKIERFDFSQNPRPPTFSVSVKFDFQIVRVLEKISQNINPRSPPANLS